MQSGDRVWQQAGLPRRPGWRRTAWPILYDESFSGLYAFVLWHCAGLRDDADDVVQGAWLTAVRRIGRFDPARGCLPTG